MTQLLNTNNTKSHHAKSIQLISVNKECHCITQNWWRTMPVI